MDNGEVVAHRYDSAKQLLDLQDMLSHYFHTTTYLVRREVYCKCRRKFPEIIFWYDTVVQNCMATMGAICYLPEIVSVYNRTGNGISGHIGSPKSEWLYVTQVLQFAYCSDRIISNFFYGIFLRKMRSIYKSRLGASYRYSIEERKRMLRAMCNVVKYKEGSLKAYYMLLKFFVNYSIKGKFRSKKRSD
jgi:hypothetical protein